jgi:hypothetical protein
MTRNWWVIPAGVVAVLAVMRIVHLFRGRAMRALAARWGLQYIGPSAPPSWWWNPSFKTGTPPVGTSHFHPPGFQISQVWNVIEGQRNGIAVLIFDGIWGSKGGQPCTFIACKTEQNPFGIVTSADRVIQSHGWTVIYGVWFLWFSWTMRIKWLDDHLGELRPE